MVRGYDINVGDVVYLEKLKKYGMFIGDVYFYVSVPKESKLCPVINYSYFSPNYNDLIKTTYKRDGYVIWTSYFNEIIDKLKIMSSLETPGFPSSFINYAYGKSLLENWCMNCAKSILPSPFDIVVLKDNYSKLYLCLGSAGHSEYTGIDFGYFLDECGKVSFCNINECIRVSNSTYLKIIGNGFDFKSLEKKISECLSNKNNAILNGFEEDPRNKDYQPYTLFLTQLDIAKALNGNGDLSVQKIFYGEEVTISLQLDRGSISRLLEGEEIKLMLPYLKEPLRIKLKKDNQL